jgi:hypothetical protein
MLRSPNTLGIATLAPDVSHHVDELAAKYGLTYGTPASNQIVPTPGKVAGLRRGQFRRLRESPKPKGAPEGGRLEAVCAAFDVSERQALRYMALAKQKGLIDG